MAHVKQHYETLGAFVADAQRTPIFTADSRKVDYTDWAGTKTFEEAVELVSKGWPEGRKNLMQAMAEAQTSPSMTPALTMDVAGAYPMAALAAAGEPCSMVNPDPFESSVRPIVRVLVPRNGSSTYSAKDFLNYGAAILSYIEGLENAGFRVEVTVGFSSTYRLGACDEHLMTVLVKRAEDHLEMDRMAFVLTHAAFFRRIAFAVKESTVGIADQLGSGYGRPRPMVPDIDAERGQVLLPAINAVNQSDLTTPQKAMAKLGPMIEAQLRDAGLAPPTFTFQSEERT